MTTRTKRYEDYTQQELASLAGEMGQAFALFMDDLRKEAFERRSDEMVTPRVAVWAREMESKHGPHVRYWRDTVSWPAALAAASYGSDPTSWPERFDQHAEFVAHRWASGQKVPTYVSYL